jgi:DNA-binding LacI/PurR family transcriptional regulator
VLYGHQSEALAQCLELRPTGVILFGLNVFIKPQTEELLGQGVRVVTIGEGSDFAGPVNYLDHRTAICDGARRLLKDGHRHIGFFGEFGMNKGLKTEADAPTYRLREMLCGLRKTVPGFELETDVASDCYGENEALLKALAKGRHTAWICSDLKLCRQFYFCATQLKLKIPRDLSVVTFSHNVPLADLPGDVCRFHSDDAARAKQITGLITGPDFDTNFKLHPSECVFVQGESTKRIYRRRKAASHKSMGPVLGCLE